MALLLHDPCYRLKLVGSGDVRKCGGVMQVETGIRRAMQIGLGLGDGST